VTAFGTKAILTYHSIDASGSIISVHPDRFRSHLDILATSGVPVLPLDDLMAPSCTSGVALTFDDGFENFASDAWPLLRQRGLDATLFVASEWVGRDNAWDLADGRIPRLRLLDWSALAAMAAEGLDIGSHSRSHPRLTGLGDADLTSEVEASRDVIGAELGRYPTSFAYPFGDWDARVARSVERAQYRYAVTTELQFVGAESSLFSLPRLDAYYLAKPGVMERWGTSRLRRYMRFRHAARRVREFLPHAGPRH
jgi:peptidoglycan/xylan/chitin deacetylase (PgdA/CDA1 family)